MSVSVIVMVVVTVVMVTAPVVIVVAVVAARCARTPVARGHLVPGDAVPRSVRASPAVLRTLDDDAGTLHDYGGRPDDDGRRARIVRIVARLVRLVVRSRGRDEAAGQGERQRDESKSRRDAGHVD
jgi:hypothetical protein